MFLVFLGLVSAAVALEITIDNTSPLIVFTPAPCYLNLTDCSNDWHLHNMKDAFNGSVTQTTGFNLSQGVVLPRASLTFQGTNILFMPGMHSTAQATVVVDDRESLLLTTSESAFEGTGFDPTVNHTISVTFVPSNVSTILAIDYFQITQPDEVMTTTSPPALPTTLLPSPSIFPTPLHTFSDNGVPVGTIAAISLSGVLVLVLGSLGFIYATRRRRRRKAFRRERSILFDLHLPSESGHRNRNGSRSRRSYSSRSLHSRSVQAPSVPDRPVTPKEKKEKDREKGKAAESFLPPPPPPRPPLPPPLGLEDYEEESVLDWRVATPSLHAGRTHSADYTPWQ